MLLLFECIKRFSSVFLDRKKNHVSGNRPGDKFVITHLPTLSNVYQNIYFYLKKINK